MRQVAISGCDGSSFRRAIIIHAQKQDVGVPLEHAYVWANHPGSQLVSQDIANNKGRYYDVLTYQLHDGQRRVFYFDMSDYYGKL
jgi:hypothetical protein